ncbi:MAG: hypothetical protein ACTSO7_05910 [Candidatus Heimdallarchaeota archaeon]
MKRSNGAILWLLIVGLGLGFAFSLILAYFLQVYALIPLVIVFAVSGYLTVRIIGRAGGEFSHNTKTYSVILLGFLIGIAFDMIRLRYDWLLDTFKFIALGGLVILFAMVYKRNLEKYEDTHPGDGPHLGILRIPTLYIFAGINFAMVIVTIAEYFLLTFYFYALLPLLLGICVFLMFTVKGEYDLLHKEGSHWTQLFAGAALGVAGELMLFNIVFSIDLLELLVTCLIFLITAFVIRMKGDTDLDSDGISLELVSKKSKKPTTRITGNYSMRKKSTKTKRKSTKPKR